MYNTIKYINCYYPNNILTNEDIANQFPDLKIKELTRLTGVHKRYISGKGETSVDMGVSAAEILLTKNSIDRNSIDFIIFCSAGGDFITPASACIIQNRLGLPSNCGAFDFNQGCTGYIYGLSIADGLIQSNNAKNVLLITSEAITKTIHPDDSSNRAIFGDAATATLVSKNNNGSDNKFIFGTDGSKFDKIIIKHGRERYPLPEYAEQDSLDNYGNAQNDSKFYMDGAEVFNFSVNKAPELVNSLLVQNNITIDDINYFIFHQANQIILETLGKKLKIPKDKLIIDISETGNTVSSTIPIALSNAIRSGKIKRGNRIILAGFGVGFSWGGTILDL
ncbi:MAG: ketoacyl-ACP synthase III [Lentimicrobiaceae bacterium]|jgi:3-oxoacyl-[acyl-carrier-protein] synthase-3|nr:ketoacyl-ACP synthase III [Lentimicrobiaceae bacterium]MBT3453784.1 ketoacyl-ACP synthase III [Lentimicrobiaceae bacterium]MBT3819463.1 ketoacyl-ACP synthase III [Lentimicrobiaceae bacterium]MBT4061604.1 ketoacyl-ACP synthase III [Lentimicrobiaceae bacterium]MBT4190157.1 ketoacyl-ACP synthase III [Lentimicrobiaceae bacterium]